MLWKRGSGLIGAAITLFWAVMMGLLVYYEVWQPAFTARVPARSTEKTQDVWLVVYAAGNQRVGYLHNASFPEIRDQENGARWSLDAFVNIPIMGQAAKLRMTGEGWISKTKGLRDFDLRLESGEHLFQVAGKIREGVLHATLHTADQEIPFTFPIGEKPLLTDGVGMTVTNLPLLEPGETVYIDAFNPLGLSSGRAALTCVGAETLLIEDEPVETYIIDMTLAGVTSRSWVTADEVVVKVETPFGFTLKKATPQEAFKPIKSTNEDGLLQATAVVPEGAQPFRGAREMSFRIAGLPADVAIPADGTYQVRTNGAYTVRMPAPLDADTGAAPDVAADASPAAVGDPLVQADHPRIRAKAQEITGNAQQPWEKARRIYNWVHEEIEKTSVVNVPSALAVLDTMQGDCNEHTVLFVALARAAGVQARIAIGLVYSEALEGFGYHAWPEVRVANRWIPMDPTLGQPLADATHIKLLTGSIDQWTRLAPFMGRIQIEVLKVE
ncbi:MAG: transglutaminase-like domain-containing protein [Candidatus Hydrogenedentota bacterium]